MNVGYNGTTPVGVLRCTREMKEGRTDESKSEDAEERLYDCIYAEAFGRMEKKELGNQALFESRTRYQR